MKKIAVFSREKEMRPFADCNMAEIYENQGEAWNTVQTASFSPLQSITVRELREETNKIISLIGEVEAVVCKEMTGIPFSVFDRKGYCIFSADEVSQETLNGIICDIEESDEKKRIKDEMIRNASPVESLNPGIYHLNLKELQEQCPDISSKKALTAFLSDTPFLELHLICAHVPPWLERDSSYDKKVLSEDGAIHLVITRKQC